MPGEADLIADLGGILIDPGVGREGQDLASDEGSIPPSSSKGTCSVSRRSASGSYSTIAGLPSIVVSTGRATDRLGLAGLVDLGDDRRRRLDPPADGPEEELQSAAGSLMSAFLSAASTRSRKKLWSSKSVSPSASRSRGDLDKAAVALPGSGVEQFLFLLLGQALLRAAVLFVFSLLLVAAPVGQALFQGLGDTGEVCEEGVAELVVERGAQIFVAGGEAQRLDGLESELAMQAQRALDGDLPIAEGGVGENLRLLAFL